jgi:hypothetical protein
LARLIAITFCSWLQYNKDGDYKTQNQAYEGQYPHYDSKVESSTKKMMFSEGDVIVPTDRIGIRYLLETLEPSAKDSIFNWNFFDVILQQKKRILSIRF